MRPLCQVIYPPQKIKLLIKGTTFFNHSNDLNKKISLCWFQMIKKLTKKINTYFVFIMFLQVLTI